MVRFSGVFHNFAIMKFFEKKINRLIDLIFCLVFMPVVIVLSPAYYWLSDWPQFTWLLIACLYADYFAVRLLRTPKLFVERKYWQIAAILIVLVIGNYFLTQYRLPEVTFNAESLTALYNQIRNYSQAIGVWLMFSLVMGYALSMSFIQELYQQLMLKKEFELQKNTAQLAVYKAQINPHFLFNTLNSLYSLLIGTSERAETAFVKFIELVRYTYTGVDRDTVAIGDEIRYIGNYIDLQSLRLNSHTKVEWSHDVDDEKATIPPMIMMTFLENVFKYGVSAHRDCLIRIRLTLKDGLLEFYTENDIVKRVDELRSEAPVGLENCRGRLTSLFPDAWELLTEERDGKFIVNLKIRLS